MAWNVEELNKRTFSPEPRVGGHGKHDVVLSPEPRVVNAGRHSTAPIASAVAEESFADVVVPDLGKTQEMPEPVKEKLKSKTKKGA